LPCPAPTELLEAVPWWHPQVVQGGRGVELHEFAQRDAMYPVWQLPDGLPVVETCGVLVPKTANHAEILTRCVIIVKSGGHVQGVRTRPRGACRRSAEFTMNVSSEATG
jgi:hypothetical protein